MVQSRLMIAVQEDQVECVKVLCEEIPTDDLNAMLHCTENGTKNTCLHFAAR